MKRTLWCVRDAKCVYAMDTLELTSKLMGKLTLTHTGTVRTEKSVWKPQTRTIPGNLSLDSLSKTYKEVLPNSSLFFLDLGAEVGNRRL